VSGAEALAYREGLGISPEWLATTANRRIREVEKWENDRIPVPEVVAALLYAVDDHYEDAVFEAFRMVVGDGGDAEATNDADTDTETDGTIHAEGNDVKTSDDDADQDDDADDDDEPPRVVHVLKYRTDEDLHTNDIKEMRGFTALMHAAQEFRIMRDLRSMGALVIVSYFQPDEYNKWLNGRPDSLLERSEWAKVASDKSLHKS